MCHVAVLYVCTRVYEDVKMLIYNMWIGCRMSVNAMCTFLPIHFYMYIYMCVCGCFGVCMCILIYTCVCIYEDVATYMCMECRSTYTYSTYDTHIE